MNNLSQNLTDNMVDDDDQYDPISGNYETGETDDMLDTMTDDVENINLSSEAVGDDVAPEERFMQMLASSEKTNRSIQRFMLGSMETFAKINSNLDQISSRLSGGLSVPVARETKSQLQQEFQAEALDDQHWYG